MYAFIAEDESKRFEIYNFKLNCVLRSCTLYSGYLKYYITIRALAHFVAHVTYDFFVCRLLKICIHGIIEDNIASECGSFKIILDCVKSILRVFLNLTHDNGMEYYCEILHSYCTNLLINFSSQN